jgi:hypothetical protein
MDNGEGLDSSSMHFNAHPHRLSLLGRNALFLLFVTMILSRIDKTGTFHSFKCPCVFMNHRGVKSITSGWIKNRTKMKEIMVINHLYFVGGVVEIIIGTRKNISISNSLLIV